MADVPRHVCVILDEAYCEFNVLQDPDESIELLDRHPNLVLLRTFSKVYGLCGLRVGYGLCGSEEFRTAVDQVRQPFFCNAAAQAAALEALNHQDEVARRVERNLAERIGLEDGLRELGIEPAESQANFVWFDLGDEPRRGRDHAGARPARRAGAGGRLARPRGRAARDGRHAGRERTLPGGARGAALMELHLRDPSPALRGSARRLAGWYERVEHPVVRRELPGGRIVLVISFGPPLEVDGRAYGSFVAGLHETAAITEHAGVSHGIQAYLTPLGAERLFRMPMGELAGGGADLADLLGPAATELAERLYEAPDWPARFALLERFIAARVHEAPPVTPELEWAWGRLLASDGAVPVGSLAARSAGAAAISRPASASTSGCRRSRWPGSCASSAPPRGCARGAALADAALDSGYYDQAHFNRDFRAFAGVTPTEYRVASVQEIQSVPA